MASLLHTCITTNIHNIMFPLFLTHSKQFSWVLYKRFLKCYCCLHPLNPQSCIIQNLQTGSSGKTMGIFHQFFLWDVHPESKAEWHTGRRRKRERKRDVKVWKCIVVYEEPFPHRDEWGLSESKKAGRAGIERCWCPIGNARRHVFFFPSSHYSGWW